MSEPTLKIGREKIPTPVSEVSDDDLEWYANECRNENLRAIAQHEIDRRNGGPGPDDGPRGFGERPPQTSTALARQNVDAAIAEVSGTFRSAERATMALQRASEIGHLVSPAPACGSIPEGCALAISAVLVDVEKETYELQGKRGLGKVALDKIAGAAGISWDPLLSRRLDNGADPYYCHYKAVGRVRDYDGTVRILQGEVEIDAREGSPQVDEIRTKADRRAKRDNRENDGGASQILELRKFLLRHAESKAKNRAIRSLGVRTSFDRKELEKPFVVAKIQFTGETSDPELKPIFAKSIADSFTNANQALFGPPLALPQASSEVAHAPPPVGSVGASEADAEAEGEEVPPSSRPSSPPPRPQGRPQTLGEKF
jgi:hypothetical protein